MTMAIDDSDSLADVENRLSCFDADACWHCLFVEEKGRDGFD